MTTRLLLIRHGATVLTAEDRFAGSTDVALSDVGRHQARCLAARLAGDDISAVYASPIHARLMVFSDVSHYPDQSPQAHGRLSKRWDEEKGQTIRRQ